MSILGQVLKGTVGLFANGLDYVITKGAHGIVNKYGQNEFVKTASEIGTSTVRVTESTVKTLTDAVDGGIDAGVGYLAKDEVKINNGLERSKLAGKELVTGVEKGLTDTFKAGTNTTASAVQAGKYYIKGDKNLACQELGKTKTYAKSFGKVVVIGLLAFGPINNSDNDKVEE
ncbi:MAG: hypothetical protein PHC92_04690 [Syntrophomonadaceae bacterium]|nr:hypothetical protein [Syntrophomonadaceae bacterium]MDD3024256.1 hypothetical protein [Syntrophomonadaceae bacterium]